MPYKKAADFGIPQHQHDESQFSFTKYGNTFRPKVTSRWCEAGNG